MAHTWIKDLLEAGKTDTEVIVKGWVKSFRNNQFIAINDGSTIRNIQAVIDREATDEGLLRRITVGAAVSVTGTLVESQGRGQTVEVKATSVEILGDADPEEFPIQPKKHSLEFLREKAHLRFRTNTFAAVFRIRHSLSFAIHQYFHERGFYNLHTPIITGSDAEGAGEMFRVSTLPLTNPPIKKNVEKFPSQTEVIQETNELAQRYYETISSFIESEKTLIKYKKLITNENLELLLNFFGSKKEFILAPPSKLEKFNLNFIENRDKVGELVTKTAEKLDNIYEYFRDGQLGEFDKTKMKLELEKIGRKKGWRFHTNKRRFSSSKNPFLSICFYNLFSVTNVDHVDWSQDFFGKETNLTVSGQLEAELAALALGKVYTFGPTFRAENSNTSRHLAEFWMIEPEVAFADITDNMDLAEDFLKYTVKYILENCAEDLEFLAQREADAEKQKPQNERHAMPLVERLKFITENHFERITYTDAIEVLQNSKPYKKKKFQYPVEWGTDLQSEHERYLVEKHFNKPVIITAYPKGFKAFYMRQNDDGKTVAAMDVLFPGIGEIMGGSQREERLDVLKKKCAEFNIPDEHVWWYLETRKFGTCEHSGFGLGFERLMMFVTGMTNIRDVIPFPRTPKNAEF